ncbi:MAG TPA: DNA ligase D [Candidatus Limnocylindrales bacterium]|nr:DNA ligase D [Candidatus Limnocylindrales bacterium]
MPLEEYRRKRDFGKTPEPAPGGRATSAPELGSTRRFVIQRHRATRLHYDFRLEIDGVLVSWAVPKGPSLDPDVRRMAVHVEDHPAEYFDFEGVIPARQYGAGDVIVWDWGTWEPEHETPDPGPAIANGELKFRIHGQKVRGRFTIVRTSRRPGTPARTAFEDDEGEQWLLIHKRDGDAAAGWDAEDFPQSVKSGRTNDEVKANSPAIWRSEAPAATAEIDLSGAREAPMPRYLEPMKATLATKPFRDDDWLYEVKWDGYRVEAVVADGTVGLFTRNGNNAETYFPRLLTPPNWIEARQAIVDGEVVALDDAGRPDFSLLQERISAGRTGRPVPLVYQAFDLLYLDGRSLLDVPLEERKKLLELVLRPNARVQYARHIDTEGLAFFEAVKAQRLEGIVAKQRRSRYEVGRRSSAWLKIKARPEQELVVGGWTPGEGNAKELGAVVVGVYEGKRLRFAGKVGSGFDGRTRKDVRSRLEAIESEMPPFDPPPPTDYRGRWGGDLAGVRWTRPELVIRAEIGGWTRDGHVRQTAFKGLEMGRDPREVVKEQAIDPAKADREVAAALPPATPVATVTPEPGGSEPMARNANGAQPTTKTTKTTASTKAKASTTAKAGTKAKAKGKAPSSGDAVDPSWLVTDAELDALAAIKGEGIWRVAGQDVKLTNLDKVLFPPRDAVDEAPVTKRELVAYFARVAPAMLPHLAERPLNLHRYPNGAGASGFWQKDIPSSAPPWLTIWHETGFREREDREANDHLVADRAASLCWLANQAAFEVHAWTSTIHDPWTPTFALIDIDPGTKTTWDETLVLARLYRTALEHLGVRAYPKTTGSRGIQAWIPLERGRYTYADTSDWVEKLSRAIGATVPDIVSWEWSKSERGGKARLDYTQNAPIKTLVAPYAVRPRPGAPVSAPIRWDELDDPALASDRWTIRNVVERVAEVGDLYASVQTDHQALPQL